MQKKIVAGICAAALALAMPAAAMAETATMGAGDVASEVTATIDSVKSENGNVKLTNIEINGDAGYAAKVMVDAVATSAAIPANAIPGSAASFTVKAADLGSKGGEWTVKNRKAFGSKYNSMSAKVVFDTDVTAALPSSVARDNLYVGAVYYADNGDQGRVDTTKITVAQDGDADMNLAKSAAATDSATGALTINDLGTGTLTVWMQNGKYANGTSETATTADLEKSAADSTKSPKTGELL